MESDRPLPKIGKIWPQGAALEIDQPLPKIGISGCHALRTQPASLARRTKPASLTRSRIQQEQCNTNATAVPSGMVLRKPDRRGRFRLRAPIKLLQDWSRQWDRYPPSGDNAKATRSEAKASASGTLARAAPPVGLRSRMGWSRQRAWQEPCGERVTMFNLIASPRLARLRSAGPRVCAGVREWVMMSQGPPGGSGGGGRWGFPGGSLGGGVRGGPWGSRRWVRGVAWRGVAWRGVAQCGAAWSRRRCTGS